MNADNFIEHWRTVRAGLYDTLAKFKDTDLTYQPYQGSFSVAQLLLHIGQEEEGEIQYGLARWLNAFPDSPQCEEFHTLGEIQSWLVTIHQRTEEYLETLSTIDLELDYEPAWGGKQPLSDWIWHTLDHEIHHRAELSLILGLLGREGLSA